MNTEILKALEQQLVEISGMLVLLSSCLEENDADATFLLNKTHARIVGLVEGLRIIKAPMTLAQLEQKQFDRAQAIETEFLQFMERDATWSQ